MRGVDQNSLFYFERASHGNTDCSNASAGICRGADQFADLLRNERKRNRKWLCRMGGNLDPLQYLGPRGTLDACRLCAPNVEAEHGTTSGLSYVNQILLQQPQECRGRIAGILP